jgi:hypothetical protein
MVLTGATLSLPYVPKGLGDNNPVSYKFLVVTLNLYVVRKPGNGTKKTCTYNSVSTHAVVSVSNSAQGGDGIVQQHI